MYKLTLAFFSLFFLIAAPATAAGTSDQRWVVTQLSGDARVVRPGLQAASLTVRAQLSPGDKLVTGPTGRATLVKGSDYIVVAPRSEMRVPTTAQPTGFTRVVQTLGTLLFKVQHTGVPHFAVDTPMLAAVVKGTTFTVTVDQQRSAIQVTQGVVQVTAVEGGMMRLVEGGKTVFLDHLTPKVLQDADKPLPTSPAPSAASVTVTASSDTPLNTIATLTDGLVRADLTAPALVTATNRIAGPLVENTPATSAAQPATITAVTATQVATTTATVSTTTGTPTVTANATVATPVASSVTATVSVATPAVSTSPTVTAAVSTPIVSTSTATITAPTVTTTAIATPSVTVPAVTTPVVSTSPVTIPTVTIATNSGPGSLNSGSGSLNSGPGSVNGAPSVTVAAISTPTLTVPAITTPIVPITTPTVTIPAITTPTLTVTVPSLLSGLKL